MKMKKTAYVLILWLLILGLTALNGCASKDDVPAISEQAVTQAQQAQDDTPEPELLSAVTQPAQTAEPTEPAEPDAPPLPKRPEPLTLSDFPPDTKFIALTFDDGPNTGYTVQILDELKRLGATASFYINPVKINDQTLPVLHRMVEEGHDVENHSFKHISFGAEMGTGIHTTQAQAREDIQQASQAIYDATGYWPFSFRAPFFEWGGAFNLLHGLDQELNLVFVDAGLDTNDWRANRKAADIADTILRHDDPGGGIVLMHDCGGDRQHTVDSLALFIPQMQEQGYAFVTVRQLMMLTESMPELFTGATMWPRVNQWAPVKRQWEEPIPFWPDTPDWWAQDWWTGDTPPWQRGEFAQYAPEMPLYALGDSFYAESFKLPLEAMRITNRGEASVGGVLQNYQTSDTSYRWYFANEWWIPGIPVPDGPGNTDENYTPKLTTAILSRARYLVLEFEADINGEVQVGLGYGLDAAPWWVEPTLAGTTAADTQVLAVELATLDNIAQAKQAGFSIEVNHPAGNTLTKAYLSNGMQASGAPRYYIAITSDDGPSTTFTPAMLDALKQLNDRPEVVCGQNGLEACGADTGCGTACGTVSRAHISFYVMGQAIGGNEGLLRRMLQEGHSIENHTWSHQNFVNATADTIRDQIALANTAIANATKGVTDFYGVMHTDGVAPFSFRSPQFSINAESVGIDVEFDMPWIFAGLDVDDWRGHTGEAMAGYILNGRLASCATCGEGGWCSIRDVAYAGAADGQADGGIILIHDGGGSRQHSVDFLLEVIPPMQEMGYHFVTIEQLFKYMDVEPAWIPAHVRPGSGSGTRVNDWAR